MISMLVSLKLWEEKRHLFSDEEKAQLNDSITKRVIIEIGLVVEVNEKTKPLLEKLGLTVSEEKEPEKLCGS